MGKSEYHMEVGASMASVLSLSTQISLFTAWQLGQLRLRQELLWTSVWLQSGQMLTLQPQCAGLAPKDGHGSLFLDVGRRINGTVFLPSKLENLLDLTLCHRYLPSYQEDL